MRFTSQFLDELRARLPVSEVVGRRVKLKKAGREFKGLSPFQQEKSPSFTVNDQKGFYHDFSSGKHGDIISFLMETEGVGFTEAVERLASMAGMALPAATPDAARHEQRRKTLHDVMELAAKFFADTLASRNGAKARGYLGDRAITPQTQLQFRLGYAPPDRFALKEHLGAQGISTEDMVEAGLLVGGDDIPVPYDRFRDRVMFPITDARGRVIAFGGRALEKDVPAKYLNSPETPLFHKGDNLYNLSTARQATHNGAPLIVVEGYVDVIAMVTAGFAGAVAPLGTALTENDSLFRRRPRRTEGGVSRRRPRAAGSPSRKEPALRVAAGRPGPRRSRALRRTSCDRGGDFSRAFAIRHAVVARDRGRQFCHARTARGAGSTHRRTQ
jgi:DNA primase